MILKVGYFHFFGNFVIKIATSNVCFTVVYEFFFALPFTIQFVKTKLTFSSKDRFNNFRNFLIIYLLIVPRNV